MQRRSTTPVLLVDCRTVLKQRQRQHDLDVALLKRTLVVEDITLIRERKIKL
jgi:hypothetical protein